MRIGRWVETLRAFVVVMGEDAGIGRQLPAAFQALPMTAKTQKTSTRRSSPHGLNDPAIERFAQALRQAMVVNGLSERRLGTELGITIGTTQKYFRGQVNPMNVATRINKGIAEKLGVTLDELVRFYETGEYAATLKFDQVVNWVRSSAGAEHMAGIICALSDATKREKAAALADEPRPEPYLWPEQELADAGISDALRERMGLGAEVMARLRDRGEFDDALVEAFSVAVNLEEEAVREAFRERRPTRQ